MGFGDHERRRLPWRERVRLEEVPVPEIGPGEILVRVHTCGICGTDSRRSRPGRTPRRAFLVTKPLVSSRRWAKELASSVWASAWLCFTTSVRRMLLLPHKTFAQCSTYKKVGCTSGFEPSGEDSRSMCGSWIGSSKRNGADSGWRQLRAGVFCRTVNTCIKGLRPSACKPGRLSW